MTLTPDHALFDVEATARPAYRPRRGDLVAFTHRTRGPVIGTVSLVAPKGAAVRPNGRTWGRPYHVDLRDLRPVP